MLDGKGAKYVVETMWMLMEAGLEEVRNIISLLLMFPSVFGSGFNRVPRSEKAKISAKKGKKKKFHGLNKSRMVSLEGCSRLLLKHESLMEVKEHFVFIG